MSVDVVRRRFTVDEYLHMVEAGILTEDERVELLDGEIVEMTPVGHRHTARVAALNRVLLLGVGSRAVVWPQGPIRLSERSQPEPDLILLRPRPVSYGDAVPEPQDVLLLIEVADNSLARDRELKRRLYAAAGIPEYWIVNVQDREIEVHTSPSGTSYASVRRCQPGEILSPQAFPDLRVDVAEVFT